MVAARSSLRRAIGRVVMAGRHDGVRRVRSVGVNQNARPRRGSRRGRDVRGGHDLHDPRPTGTFGSRSCRLPSWVLERADVAVAQRIEDVLDLLAGGRDRADVAAPAVGDPVP